MYVVWGESWRFGNKINLFVSFGCEWFLERNVRIKDIEIVFDWGIDDLRKIILDDVYILWRVLERK